MEFVGAYEGCKKTISNTGVSSGYLINNKRQTQLNWVRQPLRAWNY
jgi:hypothetical protein